jgi:ABC-2 type transport system permease protein
MLIRQKLIRQMMHKEVFFGGFFVNLSLFIVQLLFFKIIYSNINVIDGWTQYQIIFFIGTYNLINNIAMMLFYFGINKIPRLIRSGKMDFYLLKPCNSLLYISFENFDFSSFPMVMFSIVIIIYAALMENITLTAQNIILYLCFLILMCILYYDLLVLVRCVAFFTIDISGLENVEWSLTELTMKIPGTAFKSFFKLLFCIIIPYGLISTVPSYMFFHTVDWNSVILVLIIVFVFSAITYFAWKFSVRHYRSASS